MDTPKIRYELKEKFYYGQNKTANNWPLPNTKYTKLCLNGKDMTLQSSSVEEENVLSYSANLDNTKNNELKFKITFKEDTEITGYMKLKLWVSAENSDDMDLFIGVKKLNKSDEEVYFADFNHIENGQVSSGWLRVSHRELDEEKSTPYQPWLKHKNILKLSKDEKVPVEIEIWPSSTLFKAGESLILIIKGSELITKSVGIARYSHHDTINKGIHKFYVGGKCDSYLLIPLIPKEN